MEFEHNPGDEIERLEQSAMLYLESAENALQAIDSNSEHIDSLQFDKFTSLGIDGDDLVALAIYGSAVMSDGKKLRYQPTRQANPKLFLPKKLEYLIDSYQGLDASLLVDHAIEPRLDELLRAGVPPANPELDSRVQELASALKNVASMNEAAVVAGLIVVRLAQLFGDKAVQDRLPNNPNVKDNFRRLPPLEQAVMFACTYYLDGRKLDDFIKTIRDLLTGQYDAKNGSEDAAESYAAELRLLEEMGAQGARYAGKIDNYLRTAISVALVQANRRMEKLAQLAPSVPVDSSETDIADVIESELRVIDIGKRVSRRARAIIDEAQAPRHNWPYEVTPLVIPNFPIAKAEVQSHVQKAEVAAAAGAMAAAQAAGEMQRQAIVDELTGLRAQYLMARSKLKNILGSKELTSSLVKGEVGNSDGTAAAVVKEDAFEIASLLYRLNELLSSQARDKVFEDFFDALKKEADLSRQAYEAFTASNMARPWEWINNNSGFLRASDLEAARRVGYELAAYNTGLPQRFNATPETRVISPETQKALEVLRMNAQLLEIRAFPPGVSNVDDLEEDTLDLATRPGRKIATLEWERLLAIDELKLFYDQAGYNAQIFRLLPGSLNEHFPYYALVIDGSSKKVVVAENPKGSNATYVFEETDPQFVSWTEMVQLDKKAVKEFGGRGMTHSAKSDLDQHFARVNAEVILRLTTTN